MQPPYYARRDSLGADPLSLRPEWEVTLNGWQELEGAEDSYVIKSELPYSALPAGGVDGLLECLAKSAAHRR